MWMQLAGHWLGNEYTRLISPGYLANLLLSVVRPETSDSFLLIVTNSKQNNPLIAYPL